MAPTTPLVQYMTPSSSDPPSSTHTNTTSNIPLSLSPHHTPKTVLHNVSPLVSPAPADPSSLINPLHLRSDSEALSLIESLTRSTADVQRLILSAILSDNAHTEYLSKFGLDGRTDRESFKSLLPIINYEDVRPHIQRIANGDKSPILTSYPISEFLISSGTSGGEMKLMPTIDEDFKRRCLIFNLVMPIVNQFIPNLDKGKGMYFRFIMSEMKTPGGLTAQPVLTSYYKSHWFLQNADDPYNVQTSPNETVLCPDFQQSMYCQMICGLLERDQVLRMGAVFASGFLRAIRFLQENWEQLCADIGSGTLHNSITDEPSRRAVQERLDAVSGGRPEIADTVASICYECEQKSCWKAIIPLVWPRTKYIDVIITGTMAQYIPTLDFYSGGLPLVSTIYGSSECFFGVNLHPLCKPSDVSYTLLPNMAYFEFLPLHSHTGTTNGGSESEDMNSTDVLQHQLIDLADVEVGREYELVVTTYAGLYRYRVGDILRVSGFHNHAPMVQFVCRKNVALSIDSDKTDEHMLHQAVEAATSAHLDKLATTHNDHTINLRLLEYTSFVDLSSIPGHYVLFWEFQQISSQTIQPGQDSHANSYENETHWSAMLEEDSSKLLKELLEECCATIEENLDSFYRQGRVLYKSIGPLEIRIVRQGTFDQLMDYSISRGTSINQYKAPRSVKSTPMVELMNSRVISNFFSPRYPSLVIGGK